MHNVFTEEVNKITLSFNDNKTLQSFNEAKWYPYGTSLRRVCTKKLLPCIKIKKLNIKDDQFWSCYRIYIYIYWRVSISITWFTIGDSKF